MLGAADTMYRLARRKRRRNLILESMCLALSLAKALATAEAVEEASIENREAGVGPRRFCVHPRCRFRNKKEGVASSSETIAGVMNWSTVVVKSAVACR